VLPATEGRAANTVKYDKPVMVVLGNPPYSNFGMMNKGGWIRSLLEDYKRNLNEKKINLDDDYIKFLRFGQWRIEKSGEGILAFITNNSYIDGITHRRMRQSLMETFTDIYILNLHGSSKKEEKALDGSIDENVFDIQQSVAISIFVKEAGNLEPARVHHIDVWGSREHKYSYLTENDVTITGWNQLTDIDRESCLGKFYFFTPKAFDNIDDYCAYSNLSDVFTVCQNAIKTDRDPLFLDFEKQYVEDRMKTFFSDAGLKDDFREKYEVKDSSSYSLVSRRRRAMFDGSNIKPFLCLGCHAPHDSR